ncbi:hypothetical protein GCM10027093_75140 [Paraburkholderia jirisanensis]
MKSQDIFLALKLAALDMRASTDEHLDPKWSVDLSERVGDIAETGIPLEFSERAADPNSVRALAEATGLSKSEVSNVLARLADSGLGRQRSGERFSVNYRALNEFLVHGVRYVFPVRMKELTRGIVTGLTAPVFNEQILHAPADHVPVWPDPKGDVSGAAVEPLYRTVTTAVKQDLLLYELLALVDSIRIGLPRERNLAISLLSDRLKH